jgi:hypothetical protein
MKFVPCGLYLRKFNYYKQNFQTLIYFYLESIKAVVLYIGDRSAVVWQVSRTRHTPAKRCKDVYIYMYMYIDAC